MTTSFESKYFIASVRVARNQQIDALTAAIEACELLSPCGSVGYQVARDSARNLIDALKTCANLELLALRRQAVEVGS